MKTLDSIVFKWRTGRNHDCCYQAGLTPGKLFLYFFLRYGLFVTMASEDQMCTMEKIEKAQGAGDKTAG